MSDARLTPDALALARSVLATQAEYGIQYPSEQTAHDLATALLAAAAELERMRAARACPCHHTTPCHERCTCITPLSSSGCRRCCAYGSDEQRKAQAQAGKELGKP